MKNLVQSCNVVSWITVVLGKVNAKIQGKSEFKAAPLKVQGKSDLRPGFACVSKLLVVQKVYFFKKSKKLRNLESVEFSDWENYL